MRASMVLYPLFIGCAGPSDSGVVEGPADSTPCDNCATLDDVEDLRAEIDELRAEMATRVAPVVVDADCYLGSASVKLTDPVVVVAGFLCTLVDGDTPDAVERCDATPWLVQTPTTDGAVDYGTLMMIEVSGCQAGDAFGRWVYYEG